MMLGITVNYEHAAALNVYAATPCPRPHLHSLKYVDLFHCTMKAPT